ncbi:hypothetical protein [Devosia sp. 919]|uniref:hypothetical protein n=1 Tax=Devosia sp. 919 TaxID=2726065 RepID=UPI001553E188|nr:hypothetical protein [Devosia sp. 919]
MFRRFRKRFEYLNDEGQKVAIPRNWAGEVSDKVAADADAAGATLVDKVKVAAPDGPKTVEDMSKDELVAEAVKRGVQIKASDNKAEILAALKAAAQPVT